VSLVRDIMRHIRWHENPRISCSRQRLMKSLCIECAPDCRCGRTMRSRAGYVMGGDGDWVTYECPADRPWNFWRHSPWTTLFVDTSGPRIRPRKDDA
jgi:hypothetical protein